MSRRAGTATLDLEENTGEFAVSWFNPVEGGGLDYGAAVAGPGIVRLGPAPGHPAQDWVALVRRGGD